jgi:glucokinase-like ROK family protein
MRKSDSVTRDAPLQRQAGHASVWPGESVHRDSTQILNFIRQRDSSTRPLIGRETGLSRAVVAQRLGDLQALGLVIEGEGNTSSGGRPPKQLRFNARLGHLQVADFGATSLDLAITDLQGQILVHRSEAADIAAGPDAILGQLEHQFNRLRDDAGELPGQLWGIGVGIPGPVEFSTGRPVAPPIMPGWDDYPVRERLSARFGAPVWVDNDVNVMALGERAAGIARGVEDFAFIKIGTGIGSGIIAHGKLLRGAQGSAGDVGHIQVVADSTVICRCGNIGCLEAVAGGAALGRAAMAAVERGESRALADLLQVRGTLTAREIVEASLHGDRTSTRLLQQAGRHIGQMLATMVNILNPSLIVIGGGVAASGDVLMASVREVVYGRSLPLATRNLQISRSQLGDQAGVIGLANMVLDELFTLERVVAWMNGGLPSGRPEIVSY